MRSFFYVIQCHSMKTCEHKGGANFDSKDIIKWFWYNFGSGPLDNVLYQIKSSGSCGFR